MSTLRCEELMICPKCLAEYVEGIKVCADCGIDLVAGVSADDMAGEDRRDASGRNFAPSMAGDIEWGDFEEILTTFNAGDIAFIKSVLDAEGIDYYFLGEFFNYMEPLAQPARLMVRKDQVEQARDLLDDLSLEYTVSLNVDESTEE